MRRLAVRPTLFRRVSMLLEEFDGSRRRWVEQVLRRGIDPGSLGREQEVRRMLRRLGRLYTIGQLLDRRLDILLKERSEPLFIDLLPAEHWWFSEFADDVDLLEGVIRHFAQCHSVLIFGGRPVATKITNYRRIRTQILRGLAGAAANGVSADDVTVWTWALLSDAGGAELLDVVLADISSELHYVHESGCSRLAGVGHSLPVLIRVALLDLGGTAHYSDIVRVAESRKGELVNVGSVLATLSKTQWVARIAPGVYQLIRDQGV